ncbi:PREDICTED: histone deacetylase HDT2 [Trachymyrmex cornetzi]|uniref:histone deacetylase HDT2 n=1 Tax=Trachymyrmex cornetzi TaxID=471704 RepID=UPI00084F1BD1|nr:PREDICTED: histone deacetylase HDT2 [Trachymyrmex cornetzi]
MKLTLFTILALGIIAVCKSAEEEYDYEEEVPAPVTPAPTKPAGGRLGGLLSSRGRATIPNVGKKKTPAQPTTPKPVEQEPEEDEVEGEDVVDENEENEAPTTTTESAKKLRNNGGVRPFRSNEDLLAALKRRRAQTGPSTQPRETAATHSAVEHTTAKSKATTSNRNNNSKTSAGSEAKPSGRGRFGGRGKTVQEEVEETQREEVQVKPKASSYRRRS